MTIISGSSTVADYLEGGADNDLLAGDGYLIINAHGQEYEGWPTMAVYINGSSQPVAYIDVTTADSRPYYISTSLEPSQISDVKVVFVNDAWSGIAGGPDRNLYLDSVVVGGQTFNNPSVDAYTSVYAIGGTAGVPVPQDDILDGGLGIDTMLGGFGNDEYDVDNAADVVIEHAGQGDADAVYSTASTYTLPDNVENLGLVGNTPGQTGIGNAEKNMIVGSALGDLIRGGANDDRLFGMVGADQVWGEEGNDTINGGTGNDSLYGDWTSGPDNIDIGGDDILVGASGSDYLDGGAGSDFLRGGADSDTLSGGVGNDFLDGGDNSTKISINLKGDTGEETFTVRVNGLVVSLDHWVGTTAMSYDVFFSGPIEAIQTVSISFQDGSTATGGDKNLYVYGVTVGNQTQVQTSSYDQGVQDATSFVFPWTGTANYDFSGLQGAPTSVVSVDVLKGGSGDDIYVVDSVDDQVIEEADIAADGSYQYGGYDKVYSSVSIAKLADFVEAADLVDVSTAVSIVGNSLDNNLLGNSFNNSLDGGVGNDFLDGVTGSDTLKGGVGDDTYKVNGDDMIIEVSGPTGGVDTVISTTTFALNDALENLVLSGTDAISGYGTGINNALTGNIGVNRLEGQGGNDTLSGGGGADTLVGGSGDDVYYVNLAGVSLLEAVGGGIDEVNFSDIQNVDLKSFVDANGVVQDIENASISAATLFPALETAKYLLLGNDIANVLTGSFNDDTLSGRKGNDTLDGSFGNDLVTGDEGNDTLYESAGLDTLDGGTDNDVYVLSDRMAALTDVSGTDEIRIFGGGDVYILGAAFENLSVRLDDLADQGAWLAGNGQANVLTGGLGDDTLSGLSGNDSLYGLDGNDTLAGGAGNDMLYGGLGDDLLQGQADADTLVESQGFDTLEGGAGDDVYLLSSMAATVTELNEIGVDEVRVLGGSSYALGNFIEKLSVRTDGGTLYALASTLAGNTLANTLSGGLGDDSLSGLGNNDTLYGLDGADTLNGGAGADSLDGGLGADIYLVDNVSDIVNDSGWTTNGEIDEVRSDVSYTLTDGNRVENLVLNTGTAKTAVGNFLDNWLQGNAIANLIQGLGGADTLWGGNDGAVVDTLEGGSGADTYILSNNADKITEVNEANVIDTVVLAGATTVTLGTYVENADARTSTVAVTLNGNSGANGLMGSNYADVLAGGAGNDRYLGGAGNDTLTDTGVNLLGATSNDAYGWGRGAAADTLKDSGGTDTLEITGAVATQVWFAKSGTDLKVSLIGTNDSFLIKSWYSSSTGTTANGSGVVESLVLKDVVGADRTLSSSAVQSLVTAMAKFSVPALGTTSLPATYGTVATTVATAWV